MGFGERLPLQQKAGLEQDEDFEGLVNSIVEDKRFSTDTIKGVIEFEKRAHAKGSALKLKVLNEALRRTTLNKLPELKRRMDEEAARRAA